jgi:hypothetical protein
MKDFDFSRIDPRDGFRVELVACGALEVSLHLTFRADAAVVNTLLVGPRPEDATLEICKTSPCTPRTLGVYNRLHDVLDAVCRYVNVGGDLDTLDAAVRHMRQMLPSGGLVYPGWNYHNSDLVYDHELGRCAFEHVFVSQTEAGDATQAVVWLEDTCVDFKTVGQLLRERRHAEETIVVAAGDAGRRGGGQEGADLRLPYRPDNPPARLDGGGPEGGVLGEETDR